ncbi:MAG: hypothetical protein EOO60_03090 [Hymenobacter sp.]|nr:MAG: hypothetical protein EOO60_03090 [Hymenobacter sp.]
MKLPLTAASSLAFAALLLAAHAQTPTTTISTPNPAKKAAKTADQRAETYKGPKVVKDTKALGNKMLRDSKPTDSRSPIRVAPVKQ